MFKLFISALCLLGAAAEDSKYISVCSASNPSILGKYVFENKGGE